MVGGFLWCWIGCIIPTSSQTRGYHGVVGRAWGAASGAWRVLFLHLGAAFLGISVCKSSNCALIICAWVYTHVILQWRALNASVTFTSLESQNPLRIWQRMWTLSPRKTFKLPKFSSNFGSFIDYLKSWTEQSPTLRFPAQHSLLPPSFLPPCLLRCWVRRIVAVDGLPAFLFHAASLAHLWPSLSVIHPWHHCFHHERFLLKKPTLPALG